MCSCRCCCIWRWIVGAVHIICGCPWSVQVSPWNWMYNASWYYLLSGKHIIPMICLRPTIIHRHWWSAICSTCGSRCIFWWSTYKKIIIGGACFWEGFFELLGVVKSEFRCNYRCHGVFLRLISVKLFIIVSLCSYQSYIWWRGHIPYFSRI